MAIRIIRREKVQKVIDHALTVNRDLPDQHPISAITGLDDSLQHISQEIIDISNSISDKIVVGGNENIVYEIGVGDWFLDTLTGEYSHIVNHGLKTENLITDFYSVTKRHLDLDYSIEDEDSIKVYVDSPKYVKVVVNASLGMLTESLRTIKTSDFLDDSGIKSNKSWSSFKINQVLADYAKRADVYNKIQSNLLFASKNSEHTHTNPDVLDGFSTNEYGDLLFNGVSVLTNVEPKIKVLTFDNQDNAILNLVIDTAPIYQEIKGIFIAGSEFIIKNNIPSVDEASDINNRTNLVVIDGGLEVLNVFIKPGETQKYLLGTSPNVKVYVQGQFSAQYTVEALTQIGNLALNQPLIQDYITADNSTWSSFKIAAEIESGRKLNLKQLDDVVMNSKVDNLVLAYSALTDKFVAVDVNTIVTGAMSGTSSLKQFGFTNITGSVTNPVTVEIPINTTDFKFNRVNVLKFMPSVDNVIKVESSFSILDKNNFISSDYVTFNETMELQDSYAYSPKAVSAVALGGSVATYEVDLTHFKTVFNLLNDADSTSLADNSITLQAVPNDILIVQKNNIDLSTVKHIDYFKLNGTGDKLRIVVSADEGTTWKTYNVDHWETIDLTLDSVKTNGISLDVFNTVINSTAWNELLNNSVRFAYYLAQDDVDDIENLTELQIQYDSFGTWAQAKDSEYDVLFVSNTLMKVVLYFTGDIKINF